MSDGLLLLHRLARHHLLPLLHVDIHPRNPPRPQVEVAGVRRHRVILVRIHVERCGLAEDLLEGTGQLFGGLPGGLAYAVVIVGAILGAITGTVAASVIAMGVISLICPTSVA